MSIFSENATSLFDLYNFSLLEFNGTKTCKIHRIHFERPLYPKRNQINKTEISENKDKIISMGICKL